MLRFAPLVFVSMFALAAPCLSASSSVAAETSEEEKAWSVKAPLKPSGGSYFTERLELNVPIHRQKDERWKDVTMGSSRITLGAKGCAVAAASMVLASYGFDVDPQRLNQFLHQRSGYSSRTGLLWNAAAQYEPGKLRVAYEGLPSYALIDASLKRGNPVIVRVATIQGPHFVVIAGKEGFDYLICDPGSGSARGLHPLSMFRTMIETLRYYEPL